MKRSRKGKVIVMKFIKWLLRSIGIIALSALLYIWFGGWVMVIVMFSIFVVEGILQGIKHNKNEQSKIDKKRLP